MRHTKLPTPVHLMRVFGISDTTALKYVEQPTHTASGQSPPKPDRQSQPDDLLARLSPLRFDHINFLGRYAFFRPQEAGRRPLREPSTRRGQRQRPAVEGGSREGRAACGWPLLRRPRPDGSGVSGGPGWDRVPRGPTLTG